MLYGQKSREYLEKNADSIYAILNAEDPQPYNLPRRIAKVAYVHKLSVRNITKWLDMFPCNCNDYDKKEFKIIEIRARGHYNLAVFFGEFR